MAVQKNRKTPSKRGMRRSHDALTGTTLSTDPVSGENTEAIIAELPIDTATFLMNEKRYEVSQIENRLGTRLVIIPSAHLQGPQLNIRRLRSEDIDEMGYQASHELKSDHTSNDSLEQYSPEQRPPEAAVKLEQLSTKPPRACLFCPLGLSESGALEPLSALARLFWLRRFDPPRCCPELRRRLRE